MGCGEGERQEGSPSPHLHGRQQGRLAAWERLPPVASRWEGSHKEQRVGRAMAPHPGSRSQTSPALPPPWEANTGSPLPTITVRTDQKVIATPSAGLGKWHFSPKPTLSRAEQGTCLLRLHGKGKYPWNLLFTQQQIKDLTP